MKPDVTLTVQHLSRYLRNHPEACDTSEGIARWWVDADPPLLPLTVVEAALGWMSACGVVESSRAVDGRVRYRRVADAQGIDAKLEAMATDPQAVLPIPVAERRLPRVH
jgi:hypothetical protein